VPNWQAGARAGDRENGR